MKAGCPGQHLGANASAGAKVYILMWQCQNCQYQNDEWDEVCARCTAPRGASSVLAVPAEGEAGAGPGSAEVSAQVQVKHEPEIAVPGSEFATVTTRPPEPVSPVDSPASPAAKLSTDRTEAQVPAVPAAAPAPVPAAEPPVPPLAAARGRLDAVVTTLILVCIFGLVIVGWLAVQRGFFNDVLGRVENASQSDGAVDGTEAVLPDDPLEALNDRGVPKLKQFREYAEVLRDTDAALEGNSVSAVGETGSLSSESQQWLEGLGPVAEALILQYDSFEAKAAANHEGELEQYKIMLREQFAARMQNLLEPIAQARSRDISGNLQAYMIGDRLIAALDKHGQIDSSPLKDRWLAALRAREQLNLDTQNAEVYRQLEARLAALTELHQDYSSSFSEAPPYKIRNGIIDATAGKLLGLYNDLAVKIEEFTSEFEEYSAGLDPALDSDRRKELIKQFIELAQEDHEYAFTETYKLYAKDKELSHPAYLELGKRVEFVKLHWPDLEGRYRITYTKYETAWARRFSDSGGTNGSLPPTDWSNEDTPPVEPGQNDGGGGEGGGGQDDGGQDDSGQEGDGPPPAGEAGTG